MMGPEDQLTTGQEGSYSDSRLVDEPPVEMDISDQILSMLEALKLQEGDRVPTEFEIADHLGVTRQKARAGLIRLEAMGVLKARRGSGRVLLGRHHHQLPVFFEPSMQRSPQSILEALLVRQVLELGFLPSAIAAITPGSIARMWATVAQMEAAVKDASPFPGADREFHDALFSDLGNQLLTRLLNNFWDLFEGINLDALTHREDAIETARHHRNIVEAVEKGDTRLALFHLEMHFYDSVESVRDLAESARS